jgi:hypothetical protein
MQFGMKLVANLAKGRKALKPSLTPDIRKDIMRQTLALADSIGPHAGSVRVDLNAVIMIVLRMKMPNQQTYASNGIVVPFAIEGTDDAHPFQDFAALYELLGEVHKPHPIFDPPGDTVTPRVQLMACQPVKPSTSQPARTLTAA